MRSSTQPWKRAHRCQSHRGSRWARIAVARRSGSGKLPAVPAPPSSPSIITGDPRRTSRVGNIMTPRSSIDGWARWIRCRSSVRPSTMRGWKTTSSAWSADHPSSLGTGRRHSHSCSSTAVTASNRRNRIMRDGLRSLPSAGRSRSTTCFPTPPTAVHRRTSRSSCLPCRAGGSGCVRSTGSLRVLTRLA